MTLTNSASIFGKSAKVTYSLAQELTPSSSILIPDAYDGWQVFPFLSNTTHHVTAYEPNIKYINGQIATEQRKKHCKGLKTRINDRHLSSRITYHCSNYYEQETTSTYDFVFVYKSLHRNLNNNICMKQKIKKLQSSVNDKGSLYIYYHLAIDENDTMNYPENQYLKINEMMSYFDSNEWDFIYYKERIKPRKDGPHYKNKKVHYHKIGYIYVKRKTQKDIIHTYHFNISAKSIVK